MFAQRAGVDPVEAMVCTVSGRLAERLPLDDEYRAAVRVLGEQCLLELVVLVGYYAMLAQMMSVFGVAGPESAQARGTA